MNVVVSPINELEVETLANLSYSIPVSDRCDPQNPDIVADAHAIGLYTRGEQAFVAKVADVPKGFALFRRDGAVKFLVVPLNDEFEEVTKALLDAVTERCGACHGTVTNLRIRNRIKALGYREEDRGWITRADS